VAYTIIAITMAAVFFGYPPIPVFLAGTFAVWLNAYIVSRHPSILRLGAVFAMVATSHFLLKYIMANAPGDQAKGFEVTVLQLATSERLLLALSAIVMFLSVVIGLFGQDRSVSVRAAIVSERDRRLR